MKRLLCVCAVIVLLLAGCGSAGGKNSSQTAAPQPGEAEIPVVSSAVEEPAVDVDGEPDTAEPGDTVGEPEPGRQVLRLAVPEGYTLARIGMTLEDMGVCTVEEFIGAAQEGDFSDYSLIAALAPDETRCFALEGYLFPATYEIYADETPESIIRRMLAHSERTFGSELRSQIDAYGMTVEEVVILASIIQKESFGDGVMSAVSSVLHNRLDIGMQLQCDVTITYVEGAIKPFISGDIDRYNEHYNTYKCPALPAGPICNPGLPAIRAAIDPANTDYLYFVTDPDQNYLFAADYDEHLENVAAVGL